MIEDLHHGGVQLTAFQHAAEVHTHMHLCPDGDVRVEAPETAKDARKVATGRVFGQTEQKSSGERRL